MLSSIARLGRFRLKEVAVVPVAMLLVALPAGLFAHTLRQALAITLAVFAALLIVQSIVVASSSTDALPAVYWIVQVVSLAVGLALLRLGVFLRSRRATI
jgi:lipid-A-disaccharide synthase-like uncharacterized protein